MAKNFWHVRLSKKTEKNLARLPQRVQDALDLLLLNIEENGPVRGNWPNYSKLDSKRHHCHLRKGRPTYVAVWIETEIGVQVEVIYAGTHEKAPY